LKLCLENLGSGIWGLLC